jgi:hypothetical protein
MPPAGERGLREAEPQAPRRRRAPRNRVALPESPPERTWGAGRSRAGPRHVRRERVPGSAQLFDLGCAVRPVREGDESDEPPELGAGLALGALRVPPLEADGAFDPPPDPPWVYP